MSNRQSEQQLSNQIVRTPKYADLAETLVARIARDEAKKNLSPRAAIQSARTRLHRLTGAFLAPKINYAQWLNNFQSLEPLDSSGLQSTSRLMMRLHASTAERLPFLSEFYHTTLATIDPVSSVLDLACGLNPLAIPWMPLADHFTYMAVDVVSQLIYFLNQYFAIRNLAGTALTLDLSHTLPTDPVQLALLMKALPLMEQIEHGLSQRILDHLNAQHILVTYPLQSLGGRSKGMKETYRAQFDQLISGRAWKIQEFLFPNEVAYLITK